LSTQEILSLAAPGVRQLAPYVPGKPTSELERELGPMDCVKLASNENPLGPGERAREAVQSVLGDIGLYPDGGGFTLKERLSTHHRVPKEWITLGNGSNDLLVLLAEAFLTAETAAIYSEYGFAIYPLVVQATGAQAYIAPALPASDSMPLGHDLEAMSRLVTERTRLVFIANPNNPTGTWLSADALQRFLRGLPRSVIAVVDEAYFEYSRAVDCPDATVWVRELPNLVVLRTFSKAHGLAGLRVGYALSQEGIADILNRVRQPFNVNSLALAAATAALDDAPHLQRTLAVNQAGLQQMRAGVRRLDLTALPSACNFLLVDLGQSAMPVCAALERQGVIVRPVGGYGLPNHVRVTVGTTQQNERFLQALACAVAAC
jgi:histidinol-phosphate aminotransferase